MLLFSCDLLPFTFSVLLFSCDLSDLPFYGCSLPIPVALYLFPAAFILRAAAIYLRPAAPYLFPAAFILRAATLYLRLAALAIFAASESIKQIV